MAEPGYEHENMFSRIGRAVFGAPDRDVKPGRDQPSPYGDTKGREVVIPNPLPPNYRAEPPAAIETRPPTIHGASSAPPSPNLKQPERDVAARHAATAAADASVLVRRISGDPAFSQRNVEQPGRCAGCKQQP